MGITRYNYTGFVIATTIVLLREGITVEAAGAFLSVALIGKWAYSRLTRTEPPPTSDTLLGAYEALPPPPADEVLKTQWLTKREMGVLAALAVLAGIHFLTRDKGGFIHVVGSNVVLYVDAKQVEPSHHVERHFSYSVPNGPHRVWTHDPVAGIHHTRQVDIHEGEAFMVSTTPDLCIVQVDMATLKYGQPLRQDGAALPVLARFTDSSAPVLIPQNAFLDVAELPDARPESPSPSLLTLIPCPQAQDDQRAWGAVRTSIPLVEEWARRAGYTNAQPAQARETPP